MTFADRLKELRKENGMTQMQLAETMGVSKGTVAMWETGKREASFDALCALSNIFNRRIDYIMGHSNDASPADISEKDVDDLARWELEDRFQEIILAYLSLDDFGKNAVESLIRAEKLRCHEQQSLSDTGNIQLSIRLK